MNNRVMLIRRLERLSDQAENWGILWDKHEEVEVE
jgi:hypothetical protein